MVSFNQFLIFLIYFFLQLIICKGLKCHVCSTVAKDLRDLGSLSSHEAEHIKSCPSRLWGDRSNLEDCAKFPYMLLNATEKLENVTGKRLAELRSIFYNFTFGYKYYNKQDLREELSNSVCTEEASINCKRRPKKYSKEESSWDVCIKIGILINKSADLDHEDLMIIRNPILFYGCGFNYFDVGDRVYWRNLNPGQCKNERVGTHFYKICICNREGCNSAIRNNNYVNFKVIILLFFIIFCKFYNYEFNY